MKQTVKTVLNKYLFYREHSRNKFLTKVQEDGKLYFTLTGSVSIGLIFSAGFVYGNKILKSILDGGPLNQLSGISNFWRFLFIRRRHDKYTNRIPKRHTSSAPS